MLIQKLAYIIITLFLLIPIPDTVGKDERYTAQSPSGNYALRFSQMSNSGSSGDSASFQVKDTVKLAVSSMETQLSSSYAIFNPLGIGTYANNGVVIGIVSNTTIELNWTENSKPISFRHYNVYRAEYVGGEKPGLLVISDFVQINSAPVTLPTYTDPDLAPNTLYWYYIEMEELDGTRTQWTAPRGGRTGELEVTEERLLWFLLGEETLSSEEMEAADTNDDDKVDVSDIIYKKNEE